MTPAVVIEGYEDLHPISSGDRVKVWRGRRRGTGEEVAIKVISSGQSADDWRRMAAEKAGAELQQLVASKDERVVKVHQITPHNGDLIIEMEYVRGEDVEKAIGKGLLNPASAAMISLELCRMLDILYRFNGTVHSDLKPSHVLRQSKTGIKVIDFGIALRVDDPEGSDNRYHTAPYSSPERLRTGKASHQSDLWSVGVMLYEMAMGGHPYASGTNDVTARILSGKGPNPFPREKPCPEVLRQVIRKALSDDPAARYQDAREMADALASIVERPSPPSRRVSVPEPQLGPAQSGDSPKQSRRLAPPPLRRPDRQPWLGRWGRGLLFLILAGIALLIVVILVAANYNDAKTAITLKRALDQDQINPDRAWEEATQSGNATNLVARLSGLHKTLVNKLIAAGEAPIVDFRNDVPKSREAGWQRAVVRFQRVLAIDPKNQTALGELELCKGQLMRIQSRRLAAGHRVYDAQQQSEAIQDLENARRILPKSFDPYLGLAPIYVYDKPDIDRGLKALDEAKRRGHPEGKREGVERADALRTRGVMSQVQAREPGLPPERERELLESARRDLETSRALYQMLADFSPNIPGLLGQIDKRLAIINKRLAELN